MSNLTTRVLTSVIFVIALLGSIFLGDISSMILFLVIILLCQREFYLLFQNTEVKPQVLPGILGGCFIFLASVSQYLFGFHLSIKIIGIPIIFSLFLFELYRKQQKPIQNIATTILGIVYISVPLTLLYKLAYYDGTSIASDYNYSILYGYFFILWANDTGAYFSGSNFGKHKLFERISPKKTWEGSIGGMIAGLLVGYVNSIIFTELSLYTWLGMSVLIVIFGSLGDLVESMFKRSLNIKDSGKLLPGHGGVLDRFDGIFISAPIVYAYLILLAL